MLASRLNGQSDFVRQRVAVLASRGSCKGSMLVGSSDEATAGSQRVHDESTTARKVIIDLDSNGLVVCKVGSDLWD